MKGTVAELFGDNGIWRGALIFDIPSKRKWRTCSIPAAIAAGAWCMKFIQVYSPTVSFAAGLQKHLNNRYFFMYVIQFSKGFQPKIPDLQFYVNLEFD